MRALHALDSRAEDTYRAMLAHPEAGVRGLADLLSCSEQDVRTSLDELSELALIRPSEDGSVRAVPPELAMEVLLTRQQADLAAQQQRVEAARAAAARLIADLSDLHPASQAGVEQLEGVEQIREKLTLLTRRVRREVMGFAPNGAHTRESLEAAKPLDAELLARGVRMRTVYLDSVRNSPHTVAYAEWLAERGGAVRTAPSLPVRMIITDRETAILPVRAGNAREAAVLLRGQGTLTALCALFDGVWDSAVDLAEVSAPDEHGLSAQDREVLRFLALGLTDDAIARRIGVSPRTARRTASHLMDRLGARSRFQAGALAARHGWLQGLSTS